jgi:hypothetical protein
MRAAQAVESPVWKQDIHGDDWGVRDSPRTRRVALRSALRFDAFSILFDTCMHRQFLMATTISCFRYIFFNSLILNGVHVGKLEVN